MKLHADAEFMPRPEFLPTKGKKSICVFVPRGCAMARLLRLLLLGALAFTCQVRPARAALGFCAPRVRRPIACSHTVCVATPAVENAVGCAGQRRRCRCDGLDHFADATGRSDGQPE